MEGYGMHQQNQTDLPEQLTIDKIIQLDQQKMRIQFQETDGGTKEYVCVHYRDVVKIVEREVVDTPFTYLFLGMGFVLASVQPVLDNQKRLDLLNQAIFELSHANTRNINEKSFFLEECLKEAIESKEDNMPDKMFSFVKRDWQNRCRVIGEMASNFIQGVPENQRIAVLGMDLVYRTILKSRMQESDKNLVYVDEYLEAGEAIMSELDNNKINVLLVYGELIARNGSTKVNEESSKCAKEAFKSQIPVYVMGIPAQDLYSGRDFKLMEPEYEKLLMPSKITEIITDKGRYRPEYLEGSFDEYNSEFY